MISTRGALILPMLLGAMRLAGGEPPACADASAGSPAAPAYRWQSKTTHRYEYLRRTTVQEPGAAPLNPAETGSSVGGVLLLAVEETAADGSATATLQLLDPRVVLPPVRQFETAARDAPQALRTAQAAEQYLRETIWRVRLHPDGRVALRKREGPEPAELQKRMAQAQHLSRMKPEDAAQAVRLMEQAARFDSAPADLELFAPFETAAPPAKTDGLARWQPFRRVRRLPSDADGRIEIKLERVLPETAKEAAEAPLPPAVRREAPFTAGVEKLEMLAGSACFDAQLGLLDGLKESYRLHTVCKGKQEEERRVVTVEHQLKRLAPPLREAGKTP